MKSYIYIDESGDLSKSEKFVIGGCITYNNDTLIKITKNKLTELQQKHNVGENIRHRTKLDERRIPITQELFESVKGNAQFLSIRYNNKKSSIHSTYMFYLDMLSNLILNFLYDALKQSDDFEDNIEVFLIAASRRDGENGIKISDKDYEQMVKDTVQSLQVEYGFKNKVIVHTEIENATKNYGLILADYFCNTLYNQENYKNSKQLLEIVPHKIYELNTYELKIDQYIQQKDYHSLLRIYTNACRLESSNIQQAIMTPARQIVKDHMMSLTNSNDSRYFTTGLNSYLQVLEEESNTIRNYDEIIKTYNQILELIQLTSLQNKDELEFVVNTELLAVSNHSGRVDIARKCISKNTELLPKIATNLQLIETIFTFYNISAVHYQHTYNSKDAIIAFEQAIKQCEEYETCKTLLGGIFNADVENMDKSTLAKLHGSRGQAYMMNYILTQDPQDIQKAEDDYFKAIELFGANTGEIIREYTYLIHLARIKNSREDFWKYLTESTKLRGGNIENHTSIIKFVCESNDSYLKGQLLAFSLMDNESSQKIRKHLIPQRANLQIHKPPFSVFFVRDWANLLYLENDNDNGLAEFSKQYSWLNKQQSTAFNLIQISLAIVELQASKDGKVCAKATHKIVDNIKTLSEFSPTFRDLFARINLDDLENELEKLKSMMYF